MNTELFITLVSVLGAVTSLIAAIAAFRRDEIKAKLEKTVLQTEDERKRHDLQATVAEETVDLYRRLSAQYETINEKDKKLLRTLTYVIRRLIVLDRTVADFISEMESRWEDHHRDSDTIQCPFYDRMTEHLVIRMKGIEDIVRETMDEIDHVMFNGTGPVIRPKKDNEIVDTVTEHKE